MADDCFMDENSEEYKRITEKFKRDLEESNRYTASIDPKDFLERWDPMDDYNDELDYAPAQKYVWFVENKEELEPIEFDEEAAEIIRKAEEEYRKNLTEDDEMPDAISSEDFDKYFYDKDELFEEKPHRK